jgi:hypothetical protein
VLHQIKFSQKELCGRINSLKHFWKIFWANKWLKQKNTSLAAKSQLIQQQSSWISKQKLWCNLRKISILMSRWLCAASITMMMAYFKTIWLRFKAVKPRDKHASNTWKTSHEMLSFKSTKSRVKLKLTHFLFHIRHRLKMCLMSPALQAKDVSPLF